MNIDTLSQVARAMVASGKGLIAADESTPTNKKRFDAVGIPSTEETRRAYREVILGAEGIERYTSGVILFDETIRQNASDGTPFPKLLAQKGVLPGIKVDQGARDFPGHPGEKVTAGLDGLAHRLAEYKTFGAQFAKWRAVIAIEDGIPTDGCIDANAQALARYAKLCQEADIVPIIEPEVLIDGNHSIEESYRATSKTLKKVFEEIERQEVRPEGMILKTSMVISGKEALTQSTPDEVADWTLKCLSQMVPENLAGVVFLSGGQSDEGATANLNAINKKGGASWPLSFSYSRAIQNPVLKIWAENMATNIEKARAALLFRLKMNSLASQGKYSAEMEKERPY